MRYRKLGNTGLQVSQIGLGGEWLQRHNADECAAVIRRCEEQGINILDCWMSEPDVRSHIGDAIRETRKNWIIQGHIGSTWQKGQYVRTRNLAQAQAAFTDLLHRFHTDYIDLGMIHYVDDLSDWNCITQGDFLPYVRQLKEHGVIRHIGLSTHNPDIAALAAQSGVVEMLMFSINPSFDIMPPEGDIDHYFDDKEATAFSAINPRRAALYQLCDQLGVGITVMKGYAGGRLFDKNRSPFGVALTPVQCLHYCLTRPGVSSVLVGYDTPEQVDEAASYETATDAQKDYASVLAGAPAYAFTGQCTYCGHCAPCPRQIDIAMVNKLYDLAVMQPQAPDSLRDHYAQLSANAGDCIACGGCEKRCPFGVPIVQRMKEAANLFG